MFSKFLIAGTLASLGCAQQSLDARSFVPPEPRGEVYLDLEAIRAIGLWDRVRRTLADNLLIRVEHEIGFGLAEVDELWAYPALANGQAHGNRSVVIFKGTEELLTQSGRVGTRTDRVGQYDVVTWEDTREPGDPGVWVAPVEGVLVFGSRDCVLPVLLGQQQPGLMPADLRSLADGRGILFHYVAELTEAEGRSLLGPLVGEQLELPKLLMIRLRDAATDDAEVNELQLEALMRWPVDSTGPAAMNKHLTDGIATLREHPRLGGMSRLWDAMSFAVEGQELHVRIGLGDARQASSMIGGLFPFMMVARPIEPQAAEDGESRETEPPKPVAEPGRRGGEDA